MGTSCKKGDVGPAGEQGEQGEKGDKGDVGTANIIYSAWQNITFDANGFATIAAPKITADILNKGEVKVYVNVNTAADPAIAVLPLTLPINATTTFVFESPLISVGSIELSCSHVLSNLPVRYVIIPGGVSARAVSVNWADYNEVKKYLGIND
jgi:hypothetical protein